MTCENCARLDRENARLTAENTTLRVLVANFSTVRAKLMEPQFDVDRAMVRLAEHESGGVKTP